MGVFDLGDGLLKENKAMSDVGKKTIEALEQFTRDLEAGDLSGYRITQLVDCPECTGLPESRDVVWDVLNCWRCHGRGKITVAVQEGS